MGPIIIILSMLKHRGVWGRAAPIKKARQTFDGSSLSPFARGGDSRDVKKMANPEGAKAREPYKNLDGENQFSESIKPLANDWRGVWGVVRSPP